MIVFQYDPAILARFLTVVGGVILAQNMTNGPTPGSLQTMYQAEQQATLQRIGATPLSQIPQLAAWRSAFRGFDVDPTQYLTLVRCRGASQSISPVDRSDTQRSVKVG